MSGPYVLSIDQGTTSTRAIVFDRAGNARGRSSRELTQYYPQPGWVEHDPEEIWRGVCLTVPEALADAGLSASDLGAIGLTNQRETTVLWDRSTGAASGRAIVWQDRRTSEYCRQRASDETWLRERTGLVLDPYFSATKLRWILERHESRGQAFGTIDSFILWRLTGGLLHATDRTNASRTLLVNLHTGDWDDELLRYFGVPREVLPTIRPSAGDFGNTCGLDFLPDGVPIRGVAGDQQAALFGQCAFAPGEAKCTYGTGAFFLQHLGDKPLLSRNRLLTTIAASGADRICYALEGAVFVAGAAVQWLRDGLRLFADAAEIEELARGTSPSDAIFVPGFVGLGAPHWVPEARGVLFGLTRGTAPADISRATLEGVALQVVDLIDAAASDAGQRLRTLRVDGGMARNAWFLQRQADFLGLSVVQSPTSEATALGAAYLAGLASGVWKAEEELRALQGVARTFSPAIGDKERDEMLCRWRRAVETVIAFYR
ncbi:MAG: glycerol kinase [Planctomycetia bacterium]|nr:glycerol kinase [Planctomycetia bacterium]